MGSDVLVERHKFNLLVSIHAPTWGATVHCHCSLLDAACFNPRSHMGSDKDSIFCGEPREVSIHAPTWGATASRIKYNAKMEFQSTLPHGERLVREIPQETDGKFQSTLPHGERLSLPESAQDNQLFQSTLPHGERQPHSSVWVPSLCFNPRSHMGSDGRLIRVIAKCHVSIHAPTWGATSGCLRHQQAAEVSIHAPTWGATQLLKACR